MYRQKGINDTTVLQRKKKKSIFFIKIDYYIQMLYLCTLSMYIENKHNDSALMGFKFKLVTAYILPVQQTL